MLLNTPMELTPPGTAQQSKSQWDGSFRMIPQELPLPSSTTMTIPVGEANSLSLEASFDPSTMLNLEKLELNLIKAREEFLRQGNISFREFSLENYD